MSQPQSLTTSISASPPKDGVAPAVTDEVLVFTTDTPVPSAPVAGQLVDGCDAPLFGDTVAESGSVSHEEVKENTTADRSGDAKHLPSSPSSGASWCASSHQNGSETTWQEERNEADESQAEFQPGQNALRTSGDSDPNPPAEVMGKVGSSSDTLSPPQTAAQVAPTVPVLQQCVESGEAQNTIQGGDLQHARQPSPSPLGAELIRTGDSVAVRETQSSASSEAPANPSLTGDAEGNGRQCDAAVEPDIAREGGVVDAGNHADIAAAEENALACGDLSPSSAARLPLEVQSLPIAASDRFAEPVTVESEPTEDVCKEVKRSAMSSDASSVISNMCGKAQPGERHPDSTTEVGPTVPPAEPNLVDSKRVKGEKVLDTAADHDTAVAVALPSSKADDGEYTMAGKLTASELQDPSQQLTQPFTRPKEELRKCRRVPLGGPVRSRLRDAVVTEETDAHEVSSEESAAGALHSRTTGPVLDAQKPSALSTAEVPGDHKDSVCVGTASVITNAGSDTATPLPLVSSTQTTVHSVPAMAEHAALVEPTTPRDDSASPSPAASTRKRAATPVTEDPASEPPTKNARHDVPASCARHNEPTTVLSSSPPTSDANSATQTSRLFPPPLAATPPASSSASSKPVLNIAGVNVQALLAENSDPPPVYLRRQRRTRRKSILAEDHPLFAEHRDLWQHDQAHRIIARAPFASDADVLQSLVEWQDSPSLVYARLLWQYTPLPFLHAAMYGFEPSTPVMEQEPRSRGAAGSVVKKEQDEES
jgi:hypothetical protein